MLTPLHDAAVTLLRPFWRGLSTDYKSKYRATIWEQFAHQTKSAAYCATVSEMISRLTARLPIAPGDHGLEDALGVLQEADDRALLRLLRDETQTVILMLRVENETRKAKKD